MSAYLMQLQRVYRHATPRACAEREARLRRDIEAVRERLRKERER